MSGFLFLKAGTTWLSLSCNNFVSCLLNTEQVLLCLQIQTVEEMKITCQLQQNYTFEAGGKFQDTFLLEDYIKRWKSVKFNNAILHCSQLLTICYRGELPHGQTPALALRQGFCSTVLQKDVSDQLPHRYTV